MANSIYGTVLSMAMVTAYSADDALDPELIAVGVVVTVVVFWLAHAQAELLALRYKVGHALAGAEIREQLRHGWPMVEASYPLAVALVLGGVGLLGEETSIYLALGLGVAELAGWGVGDRAARAALGIPPDRGDRAKRGARTARGGPQARDPLRASGPCTSTSATSRTGRSR